MCSAYYSSDWTRSYNEGGEVCLVSHQASRVCQTQLCYIFHWVDHIHWVDPVQVDLIGHIRRGLLGSLIKPVECVKRNYGRFFTELIISTELIIFPELILFAELILFLMKDEGFDWFYHQASRMCQTQLCYIFHWVDHVQVDLIGHAIMKKERFAWFSHQASKVFQKQLKKFSSIWKRMMKNLVW